jgi:lipoprotein-releasing system permease protein
MLAVELGLRYAFSRRSALSFISLIAIGGLALSVAVLVIVTAVINGFERELRERVFGVLPHALLEARGGLVPDANATAQVGRVPGVVGVAPYVQGPALAASRTRSAGILIWGIDPLQQAAVSDLERYIDWAAPQQPLRAGRFRVVLGAGLADALGVVPGDDVTLVLPTATVTPAGVVPRQKRFRVVGILRSRSEVDTRAAIIALPDAQRLFRLGRAVDGLQLRLDDLFAAERISADALAALGRPDVRASTWMRTHGNLYHAIGVQKSTMFVLLSFLIAVAAFNLVSTLVMVVNQRAGDVAILRTLGGNTGLVVGTFVLLGLALGAIGVLLGAVIGTLLALALPAAYAGVSDALGLALMSQYFVNYLPVALRPTDLIGIVATALVLCVLGTLYPAWRATQLQPSRVLAHE